MKIIVIGGSSFIGTYIVNFLINNGHEVAYSYFNNKPRLPNGYHLDIRDKEKTKDFLKKHEKDVVIISSALTNVDLCETEPDLAKSINVTGTQNIVNACKEFQSKIVYISTSAVFDEKKNQYFEEDKPNPISMYGITKLEGEKIVKESGNSYLILRTDQPYGWKEKWHHTNSVLRVIENLEKGKSFNEITDWYNSPTYVPDFTMATNSLLLNDIEGIFHLVGSDFISRYQWSQIVAEIFNLKSELIKKIHSNELKLPVKRTNIRLNNTKIEKTIKHQMVGVKEGVRRMFEKQAIFD